MLRSFMVAVTFIPTGVGAKVAAVDLRADGCLSFFKGKTLRVQSRILHQNHHVRGGKDLGTGAADNALQSYHR